MLVPHDYWGFENAELNSAFKYQGSRNHTFGSEVALLRERVAHQHEGDG